MLNINNICFFSSYFTSKKLPYYIRIYLKELKNHTKQVVFITSQFELDSESLAFLTENNIIIEFEKNEGYDFGAWYNVSKKYNFNNYNQVLLVNDSCILFSSLDKFITWVNTSPSDMMGITFSEAVSYHIQSYFIVLNKNAIEPTLAYFKNNGIQKSIQSVIKVYEIGLSSHLMSKGLSLAAFIDNNGYKGEYSPYYYCINHHIKQGIPVIKKKILYKSYRKDELFTLARMRFTISVKHYQNLIQSVNSNPLVDFALLENEKEASLSFFNCFKYYLYCFIIIVGRPIYKLFKRG